MDKKRLEMASIYLLLAGFCTALTIAFGIFAIVATITNVIENSNFVLNTSDYGDYFLGVGVSSISGAVAVFFNANVTRELLFALHGVPENWEERPDGEKKCGCDGAGKCSRSQEVDPPGAES